MKQYNGIVGLVQKDSTYGVFKNSQWAKNGGASGGGTPSGGGFPVVPVVISGGAAVSVLAMVAVFVKKKLQLVELHPRLE